MRATGENNAVAPHGPSTLFMRVRHRAAGLRPGLSHACPDAPLAQDSNSGLPF
jgi:hypothetical protein